MTKHFPSALVVFSAILAGCEAPELQQSTPTTPVASTPAPEPQPQLVAGVPGPAVPDDETPVTDVPRKFTKKDPIKGRRTSAQGGVAGNFGAAIRAEFDMFVISIDEANQLYWPQNNFSYPKTHESYMKDVVAMALNGKTLPEIPEDEEYIYVPEQGEVGLQIRLIPGSPRSKIPAAEPGKEHIYDPKVLAAAGVAIPQPEESPLDLSPDPRVRAQQLRDREQAATPSPAAVPAADPSAAPPAADSGEPELSPNIRERAQQLGDQGNANAEGK
jgi:hypothetical protein